MRPTSHSCDAEQSRELPAPPGAQGKEAPPHGARQGDYITSSLFGSRLCYAFTHPRSSEGPSPETSRRRSGEWRPAAAARNRRPREARDPARQALRPGCEELAAQSGGNAGEGSAAPGPKSPRWSAERRARPAGRAPRLARHGTSRAETRDNRRLAPFGAPLAPRGGGWNSDKQNPGAATRRGNEEDCAV